MVPGVATKHFSHDMLLPVWIAKSLALGRVSAQRDEIKSASSSKVMTRGILSVIQYRSDVDGSHSINGLIGIHPIVVTVSDIRRVLRIIETTGPLFRSCWSIGELWEAREQHLTRPKVKPASASDRRVHYGELSRPGSFQVGGKVYSDQSCVVH